MNRMKVLTWNLGYWQHRPHHADAWAYLRNTIRPHIALLQEVRILDREPDEDILFKEITRGWGTAVYVKGGKLEEITVNAHPKRVATAFVRMGAGLEIRIASIHAPIIRNRVFPHLDDIFDELENRFAGHAAILGGDLNSARLAEKVWPGYGHGPFFERFENGPFFDCHRKFNHQEVQTFFRKNQINPFQDDHLFVSRDLAEHVKSCKVLHNHETRRFSDHIPLVAEIDFFGDTSASNMEIR